MRKKGAMSLLVYIAVGLASVYALALVGSYYLQRHLTYFPDPVRTAPARVGLAGVTERTIATPDGNLIVAWWAPGSIGRPTLLYFHGNSGSLANRADRIARYQADGYGVYMMTYRGYGGSSGKPSERANVADAKLAYDDLVALGVPASDIVLYGESLGTGIAVQVAVEKPVAGIILDAPYTSLVDVAELHYPHLPSRALMTDRYDTLRYIGRLETPLLVVHGMDDRIVPVEMGRKVHAAAVGPKEIAVINGAGHSDHTALGSAEVIYAWLARLRSRSTPAAVRAAE
ncbi:MAG: alpha/beta hydrolase [Hyphomicrobium sp.]